MNQFIQLVWNENMKTYKRSRTWSLMGLLAISNFLVGLFVKIVFGGTDFTLWDHLEIGSYILVLVILIGIILGGDSVSSEFHMGTIKLLLVRPASRVKILAAKYVSVCLFLLLFVFVHFLTTVLAALVFFNTSLSFAEDPFIIVTVLSLYVFGFIEVLVLSTLAFTFSAVSRSSVLSIVAPIFIYFTAKVVLALLSHYDYEQAKYVLFANTDLSQHVLGQPMFSNMTFGFSMLNLAVHMIFFLVLSYFVFTKRDIHV